MKTTVNQFYLPTDAEVLPRFIDNIVNDMLALFPLASTVQLRIKWILSELSTNAYKHANPANTLLKIETDHQKIIIQKTDNGHPPSFYHQSKKKNGMPVNIYECSNCLAVIEKEDGNLYFHESPVEDQAVDPATFCEHFGLLIITRASNAFHFFYDPHNESNTFTVTINY